MGLTFQIFMRFLYLKSNIETARVEKKICTTSLLFHRYHDYKDICKFHKKDIIKWLNCISNLQGDITTQS